MKVTAARPPHNQTLQWTGPASSVVVYSRSAGAVPAIERWSVIWPRRTLQFAPLVPDVSPDATTGSTFVASDVSTA